MYQTKHYINYQSDRQYRLELAEDLFGHLTVTRFYGQHREIFYQPTLAAAKAFYRNEHERRLGRHYQALDAVDDGAA